MSAQSIEILAHGTLEGRLSALFIDHFVDGTPLPDASFRMESPHSTITAHHAPLWTADIDAGAKEEPVHSGATVIQGVEARPGLHMWITALDAKNPPTVDWTLQSCTELLPPQRENETRHPVVNRDRADVEVNTRQSAEASSCTISHLVVRGNMSMVLWEWDVDVNGHRVTTGVRDAIATGVSVGAGPADELHVQAQDAVLAIPLEPGTYDLYLNSLHLSASDLRITSAQGTIPGVLEPAHGEDVELEGDYDATVAAVGPWKPLTASLAGTTQAATADGEPLALAPPTPEGTSPTFLAVALAGILVTGLLSGRFLWPLLHRSRRHDAPAPQIQPSAQTSTRSEPRRDVEAEQAVIKVVRRWSGITVRRLQDRASVSKERCASAMDALLERGALARRGSEAKWHFFLPSEDLDETWEWKAALAEEKMRLLFGLLEEFPGTMQSDLVALCRERLGWHATTTKRRLRRLAEVGLAEVCKTVPPCKTVPSGTILHAWYPTRPTGWN